MTRWFGVITLFPEMFRAITEYGITGRAVEQGLVNLELINPRQHSLNKYRNVDDKPYGGGPGMLLQVEPIRESIKQALDLASDSGINSPAKVVYLSPQGETVSQAWLERLSTEQALVFICGRYEGLDQRVIAADVDIELSIGDYVLSGGELPAMVLIDGLTRLIPQALGHQLSAAEDSFSSSRRILDYPHYTKPRCADGESVPDVLLSGNHAAIEKWRRQQALKTTWLVRPELFVDLELTDEETQWLKEWLVESTKKLSKL